MKNLNENENNKRVLIDMSNVFVFRTENDAVVTGQNAARLYKIICEERLRRAQNNNN